MRKKIVALTGAGISAESGIATFRGSDGLWEGHSVTQVASPEGFEADPALVLEFYNQRRRAIVKAKPNPAHKILADLERNFDVTVVTQNIDDLHERAGSSNVLHLHGQIFQVRSCTTGEVFELQADSPRIDVKVGDLCPDGGQLRPNIVWFGEAVPMMEPAMHEAMQADVFLVVGTSLAVYPAAGLLDFVSDEVPKYIVDPNIPPVRKRGNLHCIEAVGSEGMKRVEQELLEKHLIH